MLSVHMVAILVYMKKNLNSPLDERVNEDAYSLCTMAIDVSRRGPIQRDNSIQFNFPLECMRAPWGPCRTMYI
jgi:hypothetical protein